MDYINTGRILLACGNILYILGTWYFLKITVGKGAGVLAGLIFLAQTSLHTGMNWLLPDTLASGCFILGCGMIAGGRSLLTAAMGGIFVGAAISFRFSYLYAAAAPLAIFLADITIGRFKSDRRRSRVFAALIFVFLTLIGTSLTIYFDVRAGRRLFQNDNHLNLAFAVFSPAIDWTYWPTIKEYPSLGSVFLKDPWRVLTHVMRNTTIHFAYYFGLAARGMYIKFDWLTFPTASLLAIAALAHPPTVLKHWRLVLICLAYTAVVSATWFSERYAFPIHPVFLGLGAASILGLLGSMQKRRALAAVGVLAISVVLLACDIFFSVRKVRNDLLRHTDHERYVAQAVQASGIKYVDALSNNTWGSVYLSDIMLNKREQVVDELSLQRAVKEQSVNVLVIGKHGAQSTFTKELLTMPKQHLNNGTCVYFARNEYTAYVFPGQYLIDGSFRSILPGTRDSPRFWRRNSSAEDPWGEIRINSEQYHSAPSSLEIRFFGNTGWGEMALQDILTESLESFNTGTRIHASASVKCAGPKVSALITYGDGKRANFSPYTQIGTWQMVQADFTLESKTERATIGFVNGNPGRPLLVDDVVLVVTAAGGASDNSKGSP